MKPSQPITTGIYEWGADWDNFEELSNLSKFILNSSDIISFHDYGNKSSAMNRINQLSSYNRPIMCTEYLSRDNNTSGWGLSLIHI